MTHQSSGTPRGEEKEGRALRCWFPYVFGSRLIHIFFASRRVASAENGPSDRGDASDEHEWITEASLGSTGKSGTGRKSGGGPKRICGGIFGGLENCRKSGGRRGRYVGDGGKDKPVGSKLSRSLENIALPQKQDEEANKFKNAPPRRMLKQVQYIRM